MQLAFTVAIGLISQVFLVFIIYLVLQNWLFRIAEAPGIFGYPKVLQKQTF